MSNKIARQDARMPEALRNVMSPLSPFELWMVASNLKTIQSGEASKKSVVSTLRANGYSRIALAVEESR